MIVLKHLHRNTSGFNNDCDNLKFGWYRNILSLEGRIKSG